VEVFLESFDSYIIDTGLWTNDNWGGFGQFIIRNDYAHSNGKSVMLGGDEAGTNYHSINVNPNSDNFSFWYYVSINNDNFRFNFIASANASSSGSFVNNAGVKLDNPNSGIVSVYSIASGGDNDELIGTTTVAEWHLINLNYVSSEAKFKVKIDNGSWTEFFYYNTTSDLRTLVINGYITVDNAWVDDIFQVESTQYGLCGAYIGCSFCLTESECVSSGCIWHSDFPEWITEKCTPPEATSSITNTTTDWLSIYGENSAFATPTTVFNNIVNFLNPYFVLVSSWLNNFTDTFNNTTAQEIGNSVGEKIPIIRGYMDYFNQVLGFNFPISQLFLFFLLTLIAVVIFRIIRHIKSLLPFV
jgi:hypothetical protein